MKNRSSHTARPSQDTVGLGRTPGQRGAEVLAGLRAEMMPSPSTKALSRVMGRVVARMLKEMEKEAAVNFVMARFLGFKEMVLQALESAPTPNGAMTVVDIAAGFSPRNFQLAIEHPDVTFIEIDLPDVVAEKQKRLRRGASIILPDNMRWLSADLGVEPLHEVLHGQQVDVVTAEGLNAYFSNKEMSRIAANVLPNLKPGGFYVSDIPWREGLDQIQEAARFFSRQAGEFKGIIEDRDTAQAIMQKGGYDQVEVLLFSELPPRANIPKPLIEFAYLVRAHKPDA